VSTSEAKAAAPAVPTSRRRLWLFRSAAVLLGLSVFVVAELVCRALGWGVPTRFDDPFVGFSAVHPLFEFQEGAGRYAIPPSRLKFFAYESFAADKPERGFRIFCLGGSTVQGRPYSVETSFTTWLELALEAADEGREWETVNCGGISYASYRLVPILEECLRHEPDLFIICTGHNEFLEDRSYGHIKDAPALVKQSTRLAGRLRTFTLLRQAVLQAGGQSPQEPSADRPVLTAETDPILDYNDSLKLYRRDDEWRADVVAHYEFNLRRMIDLARTAGVPVLLVLPPSNLGDQPPFKSQHKSGLTAGELSRWETLVARAQGRFRDDPQAAVSLLKRALAIDDRYAATWYELGQCYLALGLNEQARDALLRAREEDVCPLRMIAPLEDALRQLAADSGVPLIDAHALLEAEIPGGILDGSLLVDHVHPDFDGHQMIAAAILEAMAKQGWVRPKPGWRGEAEDAFAAHFETLDDFYFLRGQRTLESVGGWTRGKATGPPASERFPDAKR
jgi:lysophospholipase L1-like esterase